jgi:hypothetical protein
VELNGELHRTTSPTLQLKLREGNNTLKVYSDLPCQGTIEKQIFHSTKPILSPNPVQSTTRVHLNGYAGRVEMEVFSVDGRLVQRKTQQADGNDIELDLSTLPKGVYYLRLEKDGLRESFKFIKK